MKDTYIICFDLLRLRSGFDPNDESSYEMCYEYMTECMIISEKIRTLFPNKVLELSPGTFLVKSCLSAAKLFEYINGAYSDRYSKPINNEIQQVYITRVNDFIYKTTRHLKLNIEYLENAQV